MANEALLKDGATLAVFGVTALKTFLDSVLSQASSEAPAIEGDAVAAVVDSIEQHVPPQAQPFVKIAMGVLVPAEGAAQSELTTVIAAALHQASVSVDGALGALSAKAAAL